MNRKISRSEVTSALRRLRRLGSAPVEISCSRVSAIAFRDIIELYLRCTGTGQIEWRDSHGRTVAGQGFLRLLGNGCADLLAWPRLTLRHRRQAAEVLSSNAAMPRKLLPHQARAFRALYLRSDHWFDIRGGGSVGHVRGVVESLRQLGIQATVVSTDVLVGIEHTQDFLLCEPVYGAGRNIPGLPELDYNDQMMECVERNWAAWRPDFIYQRMSMGNYVGAMLRQRYNVPYIVEYNGSIAWMARHWDKHPLFLERSALAIEDATLGSADLVVAVSDASRDELLARGIAEDRILVNPNGVDPQVYTPDVDGRSVRDRYNLRDDVVIGFIGTFGKWHGADVLAKAYGRLLTARPDLHFRLRLLMIGDGPGRAAAEAVLVQADLADRAVFTGLVPQDQGPAHLAACDILASPHVPNPDGTPFFGSPTKLFEYMARAKPIVASELDQIGQILQAGKTALMVPPGDEGALADALGTLVDNPDLRVRLGCGAREVVVAKYDWRAHTQRILAALAPAAA